MYSPNLNQRKQVEDCWRWPTLNITDSFGEAVLPSYKFIGAHIQAKPPQKPLNVSHLSEAFYSQSVRETQLYISM